MQLRYDIHFVSDFYFVRQPSHRLKWQEDRTGDRWTLKSFTDKLIPPRSLGTISKESD